MLPCGEVLWFAAVILGVATAWAVTAYPAFRLSVAVVSTRRTQLMRPLIAILLIPLVPLAGIAALAAGWYVWTISTPAEKYVESLVCHVSGETVSTAVVIRNISSEPLVIMPDSFEIELLAGRQKGSPYNAYIDSRIVRGPDGVGLSYYVIPPGEKRRLELVAEEYAYVKDITAATDLHGTGWAALKTRGVSGPRQLVSLPVDLTRGDLIVNNTHLRNIDDPWWDRPHEE